MRLARRALAVPLLVAGLVAGLAAPACHGGPCDEWQDAEPVDLGVGDDLYAVAALDDHFFAVGAGGTIVESRAGVVSVHRPVTSELRAVAVVDERVVAVGDRGTLVRRDLDGGADWQVIDLGLTANLHAIADDDAITVVAGDDVVLVHDRDTDSWSEAPPPGPGWGALRVASVGGGSYHVFGLAGAAWTALLDPLDPWEEIDVATDADLLAGTDEFVFGTGGTILGLSLQGTWYEEQLADGAPRPDYIAASGYATALSADGRVFSYGLTRELVEEFGLGDGVTAIFRADDGNGGTVLLAVGLGGRAVRRRYDAC